VFLGTMSACPSKYRNVTALYLDLFKRGGLLLDCGEDAYGQLQRRWTRRAGGALLGPGGWG
jgi:ribonuclease Z